MKLVHVIASLDPAKGGPPQVAMRLAAAQVKAGHDVHIVSHVGRRSGKREREAYAGVPGAAQLTQHRLKNIPDTLAVIKGINLRAAGPEISTADFVHIHGVWEPLLRRVASYAAQHGVPYTVRPAGMLEPWSLRQKEVKKRIALAAGYRTMLNRAAFIHVLNDEERALTSQLHLVSPYEVVPNGVFIEEIEPRPELGAFRQAHPELGTGRYILFLGRLHFKKGLDYLIDAFAILARQHPDLFLVIVGPDDGGGRIIEEKVARHQLDGRVKVLGGLFGRDKLAAMRDAACFCLPSRQEGFSVAILEALAMGLPIVCSKACHFPDLERYGAGKIAELDPPDIAAALTHFISNPQASAAAGVAGRKLIEESYTWDKIARRLDIIYGRYSEQRGRSSVPVSATQQLRILHVVPSLDPATGGPPLVATRLAAAQAAEGAAVGILVYSLPYAEARTAESLEGVPGMERVRIHYLPPLDGMERVLALGARRASKELVRGVDILHLHGIWDPLIKQLSVVASQVGRPYMITPHGMLDPWALGQSSLKKRIALQLGYRRMLDRAAFLHALNSDEKSLMAPLHLAAPIEVIPNGIFVQEIDPLPRQGKFREAHPELGDSPYILFLSRLHFKKGLDHLADAFGIVARKLPDVRLVVAGPDGGAEADFRRRVEAAGLANRVHVVGPQYGQNKFAALVDCAVFCLPSRQEGFSVAILEAMACRKPVVITEGCHFPEVATNGVGKIVPLDNEAIAEALIATLADDVGAQRTGNAGRELVEQQYTWAKIAKMMLAAYERTMARPL